MALELNLKDKPWYFGGGIGVVLAIVIWAVASWQFVTPEKKKVVRLGQTLSDLQEKIQKGRSAKAKLPQFREEVRRLELELDKLLRILPAERNTQVILRRIEALAQQGNLNLKRFTPGGLVSRGFYSEWPISIDLDGTFHNLALFFDRTSRFSRIINIGELKIRTLRQRTGNPDASISASFRVLTFVYQEESADPPPTSKKIRPGRKNKKNAKKG